MNLDESWHSSVSFSFLHFKPCLSKRPVKPEVKAKNEITRTSPWSISPPSMVIQTLSISCVTWLKSRQNQRWETLQQMNYNIQREGHTALAVGFLASPLSWASWNLEMLVFQEGGKPGNPEKTLGERRHPTTNSTHSWHQDLNPGIETLGFEPRPHWWEASALPTVPSLLF